MNKEKITFTLTGNFQYDLGILGLKRVLDFFGIEYESDKKFYITLQRDANTLLEDIIAKLILDNGINYFWEKLLKDTKKKIEELRKIENISCECDLKENYKNNGLSTLIENISDALFNILSDDIKSKIGISYIKNLLWQKSVNLLNNILLNFQADMKIKGEETLRKAKDKLSSNIVKGSKCSFCNQKTGKRLTRDVFFFAPSQHNAFWFCKPTLYVCPACLVSNLAITQAFTFLGNKLDAIVFYTPNLEDMEKMNVTLTSHFNDSVDVSFCKIIKPLIEYEKEILKKEASVKEIQVLSFRLDPKDPLMEMFILSESTIYNLIKIEDQLDSLFNENNISKLFGYVRENDKYTKIDFSKELIKNLSQNQKIIYLVQKYSRYCIMSETFKQNKTKKQPVKNFTPWLFLNLLNIHFKLEGYMADEFNKFQEIGQRIRQRLYMCLTDNKTKPINWNTFDNKIISLSNSFLNASKGSLQQFQELLSRVIISLGLTIDIGTIRIINKENFGEVTTTIALALLASQSTENSDRKDNQKEQM